MPPGRCGVRVTISAESCKPKAGYEQWGVLHKESAPDGLPPEHRSGRRGYRAAREHLKKKVIRS